MALEVAKIEVFGVNGKYFLISGEEELPGGGKHYMGDEGVILRPKLEGAIDAPVKSLWLPGAFGQVFVDFRWQRRDMVFTVQTFDPDEDTPEGWHTVDSDWRFAFDYVNETEIRYTTSDGVRSLWVRLLEEPKAYSSDSFEGKDPHLYNTGSVVMTVAAELPFYQGETNVYEWEAPPGGSFSAAVDFTALADGAVPASFTKLTDQGAGGMVISGGKLIWSISGNQAGTEIYKYNAGEPDTDNFEVSVTLGADADWNFVPGRVTLIGRANAGFTSYVFLEITKFNTWSSGRVGWVSGGVINYFDFALPFSMPLVNGDVVAFGATSANRFRVRVNGVTVKTYIDTLSVVPDGGVGNRSLGLRFDAYGNFISTQFRPAVVLGFAARDIQTTDEVSHTFTVTNDGDVPAWGRWVLTDKANWILPDYSYGNEEFGRGVVDAQRTVPLPFLTEGAGCVADSDPRRQTLLAANRIHLQGLWGGKDLLYPIPHGTHTITVSVLGAEDGAAFRFELPQWHTRPWSRAGSIAE